MHNKNGDHSFSGFHMRPVPEEQSEAQHSKTRAPSYLRPFSMVPCWNRFCGAHFTSIWIRKPVHPHIERLLFQMSRGGCFAYQGGMWYCKFPFQGIVPCALMLFTSQVDVIDKLCYIIMYCLTSIYRSGFIWILAYLYLAQHLRAALKLMVVSKVLYFFISVFNSLLTLHFFNDVHVSIYIYIYTCSVLWLLLLHHFSKITIH